MRPAVGGTAVPVQKRKPSFENDLASSSTPQAAGPPTTFFMTSESMLDAGRTPTASADNSIFGVRSLEEEPAESSQATNKAEEQDPSGSNVNNSGQRRSTIRASILAEDSLLDSLGRQSSTASSVGSSPPRALPARRLPHELSSQPLTPLSFASPTLGSSVPSSPKSVSARSLRPSDDGSMDGRNSQAIASSDEEDDDDMDGGARSMQASAAPQLIMPSIMMPSRRPFTENGKRLGRLKVLLAGGSGILLPRTPCEFGQC